MGGLLLLYISKTCACYIELNTGGIVGVLRLGKSVGMNMICHSPIFLTFCLAQYCIRVY